MEPDRILNLFFSVSYTSFNGVVAMSIDLFKGAPNPNGLSTMYNQRDVFCYADGLNSLLVVAIICVTVYRVGAMALFGVAMSEHQANSKTSVSRSGGSSCSSSTVLALTGGASCTWQRV